jgi:DNA-binding NarL/FixJ family response regulator
MDVLTTKSGSIQSRRPRKWTELPTGNLGDKAPELRSTIGSKPAGCISVLVAEDHTIVRQGIRALLESDPALRVVGEAATGRQALQLAGELHPDVVLMDIAMPTLNGLEATRQIVRAHPDIKVLILSSYSDDEYVRKVLEVGASGYLIKQIAAQELVAAVHEAHRGHTVFSPTIAKRLKEHSQKGFANGELPGKEKVQLTARELEVLQLIAEGYANKQTASELSISIKTVEKHRQRIMDKLDIHETAGLTRYAIDQRIIESHPHASLQI